MHNLITFSIVFTYKIRGGRALLYIPNFYNFVFAWKNIPKIRNLQVGLRVVSRGDIFCKKKLGHNDPPPIIRLRMNNNICRYGHDNIHQLLQVPDQQSSIEAAKKEQAKNVSLILRFL